MEGDDSICRYSYLGVNIHIDIRMMVGEIENTGSVLGFGGREGFFKELVGSPRDGTGRGLNQQSHLEPLEEPCRSVFLEDLAHCSTNCWVFYAVGGTAGRSYRFAARDGRD